MLTKTPGFPFRILSRSFGACGAKSGTENLGSRLTKTHGTVEMLTEKETIAQKFTVVGQYFVNNFPNQTTTRLLRKAWE